MSGDHMLRDVDKDGSPHVTDDVINTILHLAATVFALLGSALLITRTAIQGGPLRVVSISVYSASLVLLFLSSTLYHGLKVSSKAERVLHLLDYCSIFILIAGSMTPIALLALPPALGWPLFGVVWFVAVAGIILKTAFRGVPKWVTNTLYIAMGWLPVAFCVPLRNTLGTAGVGLAVLGGLCYTLGAVIFACQRPNPIPGKFGYHEIWHSAVMLGALFHFALIDRYVVA